MRINMLLLSFTVAFCASPIHGRTVFRRRDKISDHFKGLDLPPDEVDPNVAPPAPHHHQLATIDSDDATLSSSNITGEAAVASASGVVDEVANEVDNAAAVIPDAAVTSASTAATATTPVKKPDEPTGLGKYCKCTENHCDCCRTIGIPILPVRGPGCAKITYLGNEKISVSLKYGDLTLASRTISGKKARPLCVGLPGGYSKFCGRVYGLSKGAEDFKACLGFELRADSEVEAALRVSCFKFGPKGLRVTEAEPLPSQVVKDEDDDDDDIFGFGGDDDDDEDDYDADEGDEDDEDAYNEEEDYADAEDTETPDYGGFSLGSLLAEFVDDDQETTASSSNKPLAVTESTDITRTADGRGDVLQSKEDKGTDLATAKVNVTNSTAELAQAASSEEAAVALTVTAEPSATSTIATIPNLKLSKKKKKVSDDTDYAYEIINGILDLFN